MRRGCWAKSARPGGLCGHQGSVRLDDATERATPTASGRVGRAREAHPAARSSIGLPGRLKTGRRGEAGTGRRDISPGDHEVAAVGPGVSRLGRSPSPVAFLQLQIIRLPSSS